MSIANIAHRMRPKSILQVGSFTGDDWVLDALSNQDCKAILIEPVPWFCDELRKKCQRFGDRVTIYQNAVGDSFYETTFFAMPIGRYKDSWAPQISSSNPKHIKKHGYEGQAQEIRVNVIPIDSVLSWDDLDILCVDAEGSDGAILKSFPWGRVIPRVVNFEQVHLDRKELDEIRSLLTGLGYCLTDYFADCIATQ